METRANFALIGALVVMSVIAFAGFTLWMGQSQFNRDFDIYEIVFEGPVTLESGAGVRFNGISVGEVTRVAIDRENDKMVRARIRVNSETPVRTDSIAEIDLAGITGLTFVLIQAGSQGAPLLERKPGDPIPVIQSELNALAQIFAGGAQVLETANKGLENISDLLSEDNVATVSSVLGNIDSLTQNLDSVTGTLATDVDLVGEITSTLASIRSASDDFGEASRVFTELGQSADSEIKALRTDVSGLVSDLRLTLGRIDTLTGTAGDTLGQAGALIDPAIGTIEEYRLAGQDLRVLIDQLDSLAKELEQNPQALVAGTPKPYEKGRR